MNKQKFVQIKKINKNVHTYSSMGAKNVEKKSSKKRK